MKGKIIKTLSAILFFAIIVISAQVPFYVMADDSISAENIFEEVDSQGDFADDTQLNPFGQITEEFIETENSVTDKAVLLSDSERPEVISRGEVEANGHVSRLAELEENLNAMAFQNIDGTHTTYIFSEPVKYVDEAGVIRDKKSALTAYVNDMAYANEYAYTNIDNDVRVYFPKTLGGDTGIVLGKDDVSIELTPVSSGKIVSEAQLLSSETRLQEITALTAEPVKRQIVEADADDTDIKDVVDYDAVFGSRTTLRYTPTLNGFKEDIVIGSYDGTNEFVFRLKTNGLRLVNEDGLYYLVDPDTSETVVNMGELIVYSNGGTEISTGYDHRYAVQTVTENEEYLITVIVDENFLLSEHTKYPVVVDPSFEILSGNNNIMDISVRITGSVITTSVNDGVGNHYTELNDMRTFIKFPGLLNDSLFNSLAPYGYGNGGPEVQSIKLLMYSRGTSIVDGQVRVYPNNTSSALDWTYSTTSFTTAQYNAAGTMWSSTVVPGVSEQWVEFNITQAALVSCEKGIVLRNQYEGSGNDPAYQSFASTRDASNKPKIVVNWTGADNTSFDKAISMTLDSVQTVNISAASEKQYYAFTPTATGFYTFESSANGTCDPKGWLYNLSQVNLTQDDDSAGSRNYRMIYHLTSGKKYYIETGCYSTGTGTYSLTVSKTAGLSALSTSALSTSTAGSVSTTSAYQRKYFSFTPTTTCAYTIESTNNSGDPYGWLYDSSGTLLTSNDDGTVSNNFSMTRALTAGQKYYIVAGFLGAGSGICGVNVSITVPAQPTGLTVSNITDNSVYLTWSVASPHWADRWLIQYRTSGGSWVNAQTVTSKYCTISGLTAYTAYEFRVYSENGSTKWSGVWSAASNTVTATTRPKPPTGLAASNITDSSVYLSWSVATNHRADRWLIQYRTSGGSWINAQTVTSKYCTVSGLTAYTAYEFRVYSEGGADKWSGTWSIASNTVTATTRPKQPTNLTASIYSSNSVYLSWSVAANHRADRWLIQYRTSGGTWTNAGTSTAKDYIVSGLSANTTYEFRVYSEGGPTAWSGTWSLASNTATITTLSNNPTIQQILNNIQNSSNIPSAKKSSMQERCTRIAKFGI